MAVGDLVTADYMYEFQSVALGHGTLFTTTKVTGLFGYPKLRTSDSDRMAGRGASYGRDLLPGRSFDMDLMISDTVNTDMEAQLGTLVAMMTPIDDIISDIQLVYQRPGRGKRFVRCRPRAIDVPSDYELARGLASISLQFFAGDPLHYALAGGSVSGNIASAGSSTVVNCTNGGLYRTRPVVTITGPATNIRLTNANDSNRAVKIDGVLSATDQLVIDFQARTVTLNGVDTYSWVRSDNQWWVLRPGANAITYSRSDTPASSAINVAWNNAWLG